MESCQEMGLLGCRRRGGTARKRRLLRCGWFGRCVPSWGRRRERSRVWRTNSAMGTESVRLWVRRADLDDGEAPGVSRQESERITALGREVRELRRANEILKRAASFVGAELDRQHK